MDLHVAIAIQAVNMLGGVHWLPSPMPQTRRTRCWIRSYSMGPRLAISWRKYQGITYSHVLLCSLAVSPNPGDFRVEAGQEQLC